MSTSRFVRALLLLLVAAGAASSCTDDAVTSPSVSQSPMVSVPAHSVGAVQRMSLLTTVGNREQSVTVRRVVDKRGGYLMVEGAVLYIPAGALTSSTEIALTLPAGSELTAELQPHGIQFRKPVLLAFGLNGSGVDTSRARTELLGAYFQDQPVSGEVAPRELSSVFLYGSMAAFQINHFSKYALVKKPKGLILVGG